VVYARPTGRDAGRLERLVERRALPLKKRIPSELFEGETVRNA
jgi:hypothetical protein